MVAGRDDEILAMLDCVPVANDAGQLELHQVAASAADMILTLLQANQEQEQQQEEQQGQHHQQGQSAAHGAVGIPLTEWAARHYFSGERWDQHYWPPYERFCEGSVFWEGQEEVDAVNRQRAAALAYRSSLQPYWGAAARLRCALARRAHSNAAARMQAAQQAAQQELQQQQQFQQRQQQLQQLQELQRRHQATLQQDEAAAQELQRRLRGLEAGLRELERLQEPELERAADADN